MVKTLPEVDAAKQLMKEAVEWSVIKWLREKKRVRRAADEANRLLDDTNRAIKQTWSPELKAAYQSDGEAQKSKAATIASRVRHADKLAAQARAEAEGTFDEAERQLSTTMAREGCKKAIHSWELHEKANQLAENASAEVLSKEARA